MVERRYSLKFVFLLGFFCLALSASGISYAQDEPNKDEPKKVVTIKEPEDIYQIPVDELAKSEAAKAFKAGDYVKALKEFQDLEKLYPRDITIKRYIGITYDRMGRYKDAIAAYNNALMLFPYHVPTHFYKGLAFIREGESRKGLNELKFVAGADPEGPYGQRAKTIIPQVEAGRPIAPPKPKPWEFYGRLGWMYDTNVILAPKDKALRGTGADLNANRYENEGTLTYRMFETSLTRVEAEYGYSVSLNDDNLDEFNFYLQRGAVTVSFFSEFLGKQWLNQVRHDFSVGFLASDLFSIANTTTASATTSFWNQTRTSFFTSFGYTQFGPDGSVPSLLSRDGFYESWGVNHTLFNKAQTHWITLGYVWNGAQTRGKDFDLDANSIQLSIHAPVIEKFYTDYTVGYQNGQYPHWDGRIFTRSAHREDNAWVMAIYLSRPLGKHFTWRAFYRWFDTQNNNAIFAYRRDIAGSEINFQF